MHRFAPEHRLILNCASSLPLGREVSQLCASVNWNRLIEAAELCRVTSIVYSGLREHTDAPVPPTVMAQLKTLTAAHTVHNLKLYAELERLLPHFSAESIPVLGLKGVVLGPTVYQDIALRQAGDIDLLIRGAHLERADVLLRDLGYVPHPELGKDDHHHVAPYRLRGGNVVIELHHSLLHRGPYRVEPGESLWHRARTLRLGPGYMLIPAPEDLIFHSCLHVSLGHYFCGMLRGLIDIARVIQKHGPDINWECFAARVDELPAAHPIYYVLWAAKHMISAEIPERLLRRPSTIGIVEDRCLRFVIVRAIFRPAGDPALLWGLTRACQVLLQPEALTVKGRKLLSVGSSDHARVSILRGVKNSARVLSYLTGKLFRALPWFHAR